MYDVDEAVVSILNDALQQHTSDVDEMRAMLTCLTTKALMSIGDLNHIDDADIPQRHQLIARLIEDRFGPQQS